MMTGLRLSIVYLCRVEVEKLCCYALKLSTLEQVERHELKRRCVIAIVWFTTTLLVALYVPNIAIVIDVLGALAALFIFFFPGKTYILLPVTVSH